VDAVFFGPFFFLLLFFFLGVSGLFFGHGWYQLGFLDTGKEDGGWWMIGWWCGWELGELKLSELRRVNFGTGRTIWGNGSFAGINLIPSSGAAIISSTTSLNQRIPLGTLRTNTPPSVRTTAFPFPFQSTTPTTSPITTRSRQPPTPSHLQTSSSPAPNPASHHSKKVL